MTRSGGRPGSGRGGRSFRGGSRSIRGRSIGTSARARSLGSSRVPGVRVGRGTVGTSTVFVGSKFGSGSTKITPSRDGILGPTHYNINIKYVYSAVASFDATWKESGSKAGQLGFTFQGTFNATARNVPAEDVEGVLDSMDRRAQQTAAGLAAARASNLQHRAVTKLAGNYEDYLSFSSATSAVSGISAG